MVTAPACATLNATMGLTHIEVVVANPARRQKGAKVTCLVDSGAVYSVIPAPTLRKLGIAARSRKTFTLADGTQITRKVGDALFVINGHRGASPVIFGKKGDSTLLGTVTLGSVGLILDPIKRELRPLPMVLAVYG